MNTLGIIGFLTIIVMLALIMTKRLSTMLALIATPIIGFLIASALNLITVENISLGSLMTAGIRSIAPTGVMFIFAILFFGILTDAGTFKPIINKVLSVVGNDPVKICVGTVILACFVHLDGSGAVTFLIVVPAMLPLFDAMGMSRGSLATCVALGAGTMNIMPWGGPTLRAITALNSTVSDVFTPMIPSLIAGIIFILLCGVFIGRKEKARLAATPKGLEVTAAVETEKAKSEEDMSLERPKMFPINILLILAAIVIMILEVLPPASVFMVATVLVMVINYPNVGDQKKLVDRHAEAALMMASMLFSAGVFTGILKGSGMLDAMAQAIVSLIPASLGSKLPLLVGVSSMPLSLVFDPDSYYFGVMPVIATAAEALGGNPIMVARASIIGQMTTGFPVSPLTGSTFLLIGLSGVDLGEHQKNTIPFSFLTTIVMLIVAVVIGGITL